MLSEPNSAISSCVVANTGESSYRLNRRNGDCEVLPLEKKCVMFDDPAIDVALLPASPGCDVCEFVPIPLDREFWRQPWQKLELDVQPREVSVVGLYTSHHG